MMHPLHPTMHTYPGASFKFHPYDNGNLNGPHLAMAAGGDNGGYWSHVPLELSLPDAPPAWAPPPAVAAMLEGRGTGMYGVTMSGGMPFNYGWPKYGPMPLKPELGGFAGKLNPFGRSFPHGFYKTLQ